MGYNTEFYGKINVVPPLNNEEIEFLEKFSSTRRMNRKKGPYFVDGSGYKGQGIDEDVIDSNKPYPGQPGLWCGWTSSEDGQQIEWNEVEKFYYAHEWMVYIIDHFLGSNPKAVDELSFIAPHKLDGKIICQGENIEDRWKLVVDNNVVTAINLE